ncbi:hypothetical protein AAC387_Pa09g0188 [Persea americana]
MRPLMDPFAKDKNAPPFLLFPLPARPPTSAHLPPLLSLSHSLLLSPSPSPYPSLSQRPPLPSLSPSLSFFVIAVPPSLRLLFCHTGPNKCVCCSALGGRSAGQYSHSFSLEWPNVRGRERDGRRSGGVVKFGLWHELLYMWDILPSLDFS